jgi:hypothetical protein
MVKTFLLKTFLFIVASYSLIISTYAQYIPGKSYFGAHHYIEYIAGDLPIILVAPHSGDSMPSHLPDIDNRGSDNGTLELAFLLKDYFPAKTKGCRPHIIINYLHPNKLNAAKDSTEAAGTNPEALKAWKEFHAFIEDAKKEVTKTWGKGHYFDLHGNGRKAKWNEIGLGVQKEYLNQGDSIIKTRMKYSTVKNLCMNGGVDFLEVLKGPTSLGGLLQKDGWKSVPSPVYPQLDTLPFFNSGWNTWKHGSRYGGTIDATHVETYWEFMVKTANKEKYANDLTNAIIKFMKVHYKFTFDCAPSTNMKDIVNSNKIMFYPNPCNKNSVIQFKDKERIQTVSLFNKEGKLIDSNNLINGMLPENITAGMYVIRIVLKSGAYVTEKLFVE